MKTAQQNKQYKLRNFAHTNHLLQSRRMVNMVSHVAERHRTTMTDTGRCIDHFPVINISTSQKGHGIGGILKGWLKRSVPVIKREAKTLGKKLAVTALDTAYDVGRDILVNDKSPKQAMADQGKQGIQKFASNIQNPFKQKDPVQQPAKKAIKRKASSTSVSRTRSVKRKRANVLRKNNNFGFRKVTL